MRLLETKEKSLEVEIYVQEREEEVNEREKVVDVLSFLANELRKK